MMCRATAGQNQSAGHEYECDGVFHSMVFCLMCDFGLTGIRPRFAFNVFQHAAMILQTCMIVKPGLSLVADEY